MKTAIMVVAAGILAVSFAQDGSGWGLGAGESWTDVYRIKATPWED
jgi:hypothetical protein